MKIIFILPNMVCTIYTCNCEALEMLIIAIMGKKIPNAGKLSDACDLWDTGPEMALIQHLRYESLHPNPKRAHTDCNCNFSRNKTDE